MFVLSRKKGEEIDVSGPCRITVVRLGDGRVQLGFVATKGVSIQRTEAPHTVLPPVDEFSDGIFTEPLTKAS